MKKISLSLFVFLLFCCNALPAQDTIRVRKPERSGDEYCWPEIRVNGSNYTDTIPLEFFQDESKLELQINDDCPIKKKSNVFVMSFEIEANTNTGTTFLSAASSFFTDPQKKLIRKIKPGGYFIVRNIVIHAPDGFKKIDNFKVTLN